jgi:hypothetical protein
MIRITPEVVKEVVNLAIELTRKNNRDFKSIILHPFALCQLATIENITSLMNEDNTTSEYYKDIPIFGNEHISIDTGCLIDENEQIVVVINLLANIKKCAIEHKIWSTTARGQEWVEFAKEVLKHIEEYTVPQYGDKGDDLCSGYTPTQCMAQVEKYAKRFGKNSREGQELLDVLKTAHYAQMIHTKMKQ